MLTRKLLTVGVIAIGVLFAAIQGSANPDGVPVPEPGPYECGGPGPGSTMPDFKITAITGLDNEFPVECPPSFPANCVDYGYNITPLTLNVNHTTFAISADQDLISTSPTAFVNPPGQGDKTSGFLVGALHEYTVRWNSLSTKGGTVHIYIKGPSEPRITTALVGGSGSTDESCLIAGPGVPGDPFEPIAVTETGVGAGGKCTFDKVYVHGKLHHLENPSKGCYVGQGTVTIEGVPLQNNSGKNGITFGLNTTTCYGPPVPSTPWCVCTAQPCP